MEDMEKEACFKRTCVAELNKLKIQLLNVNTSEQSFHDNDEKTKFYTGIPSFVFLINVLNIVAAYVKHTSTNALSQLQEFLVALIKKKKWNMPFQSRLGIRARYDPCQLQVEYFISGLMP